MGVVLTHLSLLIPAFSLLSAPPALAGPASLLNRTLPYHLTPKSQIRGFGIPLEPR